MDLVSDSRAVCWRIDSPPLWLCNVGPIGNRRRYGRPTRLRTTNTVYSASARPFAAICAEREIARAAANANTS
eukprot:9657075-Lingulodinium_polyedra.AAC.1